MRWNWKEFEIRNKREIEKSHQPYPFDDPQKSHGHSACGHRTPTISIKEGKGVEKEGKIETRCETPHVLFKCEDWAIEIDSGWKLKPPNSFYYLIPPSVTSKFSLDNRTKYQIIERRYMKKMLQFEQKPTFQSLAVGATPCPEPVNLTKNRMHTLLTYPVHIIHGTTSPINERSKYWSQLAQLTWVRIGKYQLALAGRNFIPFRLVSLSGADRSHSAFISRCSHILFSLATMVWSQFQPHLLIVWLVSYCLYRRHFIFSKQQIIAAHCIVAKKYLNQSDHQIIPLNTWSDLVSTIVSEKAYLASSSSKLLLIPFVWLISFAVAILSIRFVFYYQLVSLI